jgi:tetraacyldisaccharide 4'-kinase
VNALLRIAAKPPELLYRGINRARRALYRAGILRAKRLPKPVISIGNIAAGGAGKTPAVIAIGRFLVARGLHVAVLTRGYGRAGEGGIVASLNVAEYGDEPTLIKMSIPSADVIVGSNRYENGQQVTCDVYLLDDGFQHLQLHRDLDVVIDVEGAWFHREGRSALRDADIVIPRRLRLAIPDALRGQQLYAFAGLADNEQFFGSLRAAGLSLAGSRGFADHHAYSAGDVAAIRQAAREAGATAIVTTEKDAVKLAGDAIMASAAQNGTPHADAIVAIGATFEVEPDVLERILAAIH